jgi:GT2 family glycosyltransferase
MKLSVIVTAHNAPGDVRLCLDSLGRHFPSCGGELLLVNDASAAETTEMLRSFVRDARERSGRALSSPDVSVRLLENGENLGYLRSANRGLAEARGDVLVLLNSDTALPSFFAERVLACFASDPAIGVASPIGSHCGLFSIPLKPGLRGGDVNVMDGFFRHWPPEYPTAILPDGFCFCLRRAVLEQVGMFDEQYGPGYFEETDLAMRARRAGWKTVLIDNLYVYHKAQASFGAERNRELLERNSVLFNSRWGEEFSALRALHPREEQKFRLYPRAYSPPERVWRKIVRFLAQAVPVPSWRRDIRRRYN